MLKKINSNLGRIVNIEVLPRFTEDVEYMTGWFTGGCDTWGKYTFTAIQGRELLDYYLFEDEVKALDRLTVAELAA